MIIVGTAGWSLPRSAGREFADSGSHLSRYSRVLHGTEINSSFARSHSTETYANWAKSELARAIRDELRLYVDFDDEVDDELRDLLG